MPEDDKKFSKSRGFVVWVDEDYLDHGFHPDLLRYYIANPASLKNVYVDVKKLLEEKKKKIPTIKAGQYSRKQPADSTKRDSARHKLP